MKQFFWIWLIPFLFAQPCFAGRQAKEAVRKGNLLYKKGEFTQARKEYERALLDAPESDIVNFNLGATLYKTEDYKGAITHFEQSLVSPDETLEQRASYNLGNSKYKLGISFEDSDLFRAIDLLQQSLRHYERALEIDPQDEDAEYNYQFVQKELTRLQEKLKQKQKQKEQKKQEEKGEAEQEKEKQKMSREAQSQQEKEKLYLQEKLPDVQEGKSKEEKEQAESESPQEEKRPAQTAQGEPQQMSSQQAKMLLESYAQEEEPKGLYKEKIPTRGLPDILKDW